MAQAQNNRDCALDCIRILSIIGILVCHSCFEWQVDWAGRLLGLTFNFLFLGISAFLFGIEWKKKGNCPYNFSFVTRRTIKLATTYYPFLIILFLFLLISKQGFSISSIFSHLVFLSWFDKIEGFGHLWFMTMILICYVAIWMISKLVNMVKLKTLNNKVLRWGGVLFCTIGDLALTFKGLPGYMFIYVLGYIYVFQYADKIQSVVKSIPFKYALLQSVIVTIIGIYVFRLNIFAISLLAYPLGMIVAASLFIGLYKTFYNTTSNRITIFLASICFEVYLVHEFFLGKFSVYKLIDIPWLGFVLLLILSFVSAFLLKYGIKSISTISKHISLLTD